MNVPRKSLGSSRVVLALVILSSFYVAAYVGCRASRVLVRTGYFAGAADSHVFTAHGAWFGCDVCCPSGRRDLLWAESVFLPLIAMERAFWNTIGAHFKPPS